MSAFKKISKLKWRNTSGFYWFKKYWNNLQTENKIDGAPGKWRKKNQKNLLNTKKTIDVTLTIGNYWKNKVIYRLIVPVYFKGETLIGAKATDQQTNSRS